VATQRRRPFFLRAPPIVFRSFGAQSKVRGSGTAKKPWVRQVCPRLHFYVVFWTYCRCGISSSPSRLRLLSVTESVALAPEARWNAMTDYPAAIQLSAIQHLRCPRCRARMKLARVSSGPIGFELRTFDCAKCDRVEQIVVRSPLY